MAESGPFFVAKAPAVRDALQAMLALNAHRSLAGYLCVLNAATIEQRTTDLRPDFKGFFNRYFSIGAPPKGKPYAVPFARGSKSVLFNANVAGSYAPSSLRVASPLHGVMLIEGGGAQAVFSLRKEHASVVKQTILPEPIPISSFFTFMYRDSGFDSPPGPEDMEHTVRRDFGLPLGGDLYGSGIFSDDFMFFTGDYFEVLEATS